MSDRVSFSPKYKEAQAIKHALEKQLQDKKNRLFGEFLISNGKLTSEDIRRIQKDIEEEQMLLDRLVERIEDFKYKHQIK